MSHRSVTVLGQQRSRSDGVKDSESQPPELGIAYLIVDGIPNMIPQDARMIHNSKAEKPTES
uniref:Uncharacterized protein n=1 Tax=Sinocyclocheilus grahami TaxID=75366 RepID=A0A672SK04_SINGR